MAAVRRCAPYLEYGAWPRLVHTDGLTQESMKEQGKGGRIHEGEEQRRVDRQ